MTPTREIVKDVRDWMLDHPVTGWYIAALGIINVVLSFLNLLF